MVSFYYPLHDLSKYKKILQDLTGIALKLGYGLNYCMHSQFSDMSLADEDVFVLDISFEAMHTSFSFEFTPWLYHITTLSNIENIKPHGLVPSSKNSEFNYENRVYLFNNAPMSMVLDYGIEKANAENADRLALLKINSKKLRSSNEWKNDSMLFFLDSKYPNVDDSLPDAIFTKDRIPFKFIDDEFVVFDLRDGKISEKSKFSFSQP